jgi:hypothetical protein
LKYQRIIKNKITIKANIAAPTIRLRFKSPFTYLYLSASVMAELALLKILLSGITISLGLFETMID